MGVGFDTNKYIGKVMFERTDRYGDVVETFVKEMRDIKERRAKLWDHVGDRHSWLGSSNLFRRSPCGRWCVQSAVLCKSSR